MRQIIITGIPDCTCDLDWHEHCKVHGVDSTFYKEWMKDVEEDRKGAKTRQ